MSSSMVLSDSPRQVHIVGAGTVGCVTSILLAQRGYRVNLYDKRPDPRSGEVTRGRSVHVIISARGWKTLDNIGNSDQIRSICMPLFGRHIHWLDEHISVQPYTKTGDAIFCVDRNLLHAALVESVSVIPLVHTSWQHELLKINTQQRELIFSLQDAKADSKRGIINTNYERLCGTDGAFSTIRTACTEGTQPHSVQTEWMRIAYKEIRLDLEIVYALALDPRYFQIWPRGDYFFSAFPNCDGTFTGTLFLPIDGEKSFESIQNKNSFEKLLRDSFPQFLPFIERLWQQFSIYPVSKLATVYSSRLAFEPDTILLGDAAHTVVPFLGQGMNCGFEDARIFGDLLELYDDNWSLAVPEYEHIRRLNVDALAKLSIDHYSHLSNGDIFENPKQKDILKVIDELDPIYFRPLYENIAFTLMPYTEALARENARINLSREILETLGNAEQDHASIKLAVMKALNRNY